MLKKIFILTLVLLMSTGLYAEKKITIAGSTTVLPLAQKCAELYMNKHKDVSISVRGGGSGVGIAQVVAGKVDIGNASRKIKSKEVKMAKAKGITPVGTVVARDGIAVIVHKKNSVKNITLKQLFDIYTGKIKNWKKLGGPDKRIVVISRDSSSGTFEVFNKKVLKKEKVVRKALMLASNKAVATTVSKTPGAIGYVGLGYVTKKIKALKVEGVKPSNRTVNNGSYKIARGLNMYTNGRPKGEIKKFLKFILSKQGQKIAAGLGYIPVK